ncbi:hypothetical protein F2Q70_00034620, partial [Brassica cretica]
MAGKKSTGGIDGRFSLLEVETKWPVHSAKCGENHLVGNSGGGSKGNGEMETSSQKLDDVRRAFNNIKSRGEARLVVILWSLESMRSHKMSNIIIADEFSEMFGAVERPQAWPSFLCYAGQIELSMVGIVGCKLQVANRETNKGTTFIAQSVTRQGLRAMQDSDEWFEAQSVEKIISLETHVVAQKVTVRWKPPPKDWMMCNGRLFARCCPVWILILRTSMISGISGKKKQGRLDISISKRTKPLIHVHVL